MAVTATKLQMNAAQQDLLIHAERRLMAPCCYTQTIDLHASEIAQTMRREVTGMVIEGKTDSQIWEHYKTIYGEQILAIPDGILGAVALTIPPTMTTLATSALLLFLYRFHRRKITITNFALSSSGHATTTLPSRSPTEEEIEILQRIRAETRW